MTSTFAPGASSFRSCSTECDRHMTSRSSSRLTGLSCCSRTLCSTTHPSTSPGCCVACNFNSTSSSASAGSVVCTFSSISTRSATSAAATYMALTRQPLPASRPGGIRPQNSPLAQTRRALPGKGRAASPRPLESVASESRKEADASFRFTSCGSACSACRSSCSPVKSLEASMSSSSQPVRKAVFCRSVRAPSAVGLGTERSVSRPISRSRLMSALTRGIHSLPKKSSMTAVPTTSSPGAEVLEFSARVLSTLKRLLSTRGLIWSHSALGSSSSARRRGSLPIMLRRWPCTSFTTRTSSLANASCRTDGQSLASVSGSMKSPASAAFALTLLSTVWALSRTLGMASSSATR
mmetsp:Transcript_19834/g.75033  ORF Transcript_19834/g.75033 Transcript_19834/m.75033 type:complete len:352 (+) Transcript_19834:230-1285(+)